MKYNQTDSSTELILKLALEGGSASIFRKTVGASWRYVVETSSLNLDENDDEVWCYQQSDSLDSIEHALRRIEEDGSWYLYMPLYIHKDFRIQLRTWVENLRSRLSAIERDVWRYKEERWYLLCSEPDVPQLAIGPRPPLYTFTASLFNAIMTMNEEAIPAANGELTGLNYYGKHRNPNHVKPQTEPSWTQRLCELLRGSGYVVDSECSYPTIPASSGSSFCDLVVKFPDGTKLWLENKGAWKEYWALRGSPGKFRSHLLTSRNSAIHDIQKLSRLAAADADYLGFLLIGFDTLSRRMQSEVEEFERSAAVDATPWISASLHLPDCWRPSHQVHAWFYWRRTHI